MVKKPTGLTAATGMDTLTHAVESYISVGADHVTDACAIQAIKIISKYLQMAVANGENLEARENMAYASLLAWEWPLIMLDLAMFTQWPTS